MNTKNIRYIVFDVDGTLTDGKLYIGADGESFKAFHVKDGYAIHDILPKFKITPIIMTGRESKIVEKRCKELDIKEYYQGVLNKRQKLMELVEQWGIKSDLQGVYEQIAYVGDDINDLSCMKICGFTACPKDAVEEIKDYVDYVSKKNGGEGAVREIVEKIVGVKNGK